LNRGSTAGEKRENVSTSTRSFRPIVNDENIQSVPVFRFGSGNPPLVSGESSEIVVKGAEKFAISLVSSGDCMTTPPTGTGEDVASRRSYPEDAFQPRQ
jgi:hypothetical protein